MVLTGVGVIISGKLMAYRWPLAMGSDDFFKINILILKLKAGGDQVFWGFTIFVPTLGLVILFGGVSAYNFFKLNSGIDIGHWSSMCAIASFFSVVLSSILALIAPIMTSVPIIKNSERKKQLDKLLGDEPHG